MKRPLRNRARNFRLQLETLEDRLLLATLQDTLVGRGVDWNYLDNGSDQGQLGDGAAWFGHPNYDDTASGPAGAWESGAAELGYGDTQTTVVDFIDTDPVANGVQKNATTYFRKTFTATAAVSDYVVFLKYDDAAAVYINGIEALRTSNLAGNADFDDFASSSTPDEDAYFRFDVSTLAAATIAAGENTIAVEIHQSGATSSDTSFDMELVARHDRFNEVGTTVVASGLERPVFMTSPDTDTDRLFIVEQRGRIQILDLTNDTLNATSFLDIDARVQGFNDSGNERGLLGLAFPPDFANNNYFYVNYTSSEAGRSGDTVVSRFQISNDSDIADPNSEEILLVIDQPFSNHNAGWIGFGPDGFLYVATGDGGSGNDPQNNAGDITNNLLGKMLRLDVEGTPDPGLAYAIPASNPFVGQAGDDEIWSYGLRNPWRNSFDRETGDLYIGDVGQNAVEEINVQPADSTGGEHYGWRVMEGTQCNINGDALPCFDPSFVDPVFEYPHTGVEAGDLLFEGFSISGGYVYRGPVDILDGHYFFGDFVSSRLYSFEWDGSAATEAIDWTSQLFPGGLNGLPSFGEDTVGNMYIAEFNGDVSRITGPTDLPLTIESVSLNALQTDPLDLPRGAQPTTWAEQRAEILDITVSFSDDTMPISVADIVLTNLGLNAPVDPDQIIQLTAGQLTQNGDSVSIQFPVHTLPDGIYSLQLLDTITDLSGSQLDGNDDGTAGGSFEIVGDAINKLYRFAADFNGDLGVSVFDFTTFSYWFGQDTTRAPLYADLNDDDGVSVFDFTIFANRFGDSVTFAPGLAALSVQNDDQNTAAERANGGELPPTVPLAVEEVFRVPIDWSLEPRRNSIDPQLASEIAELGQPLDAIIDDIAQFFGEN
jgi:glucose/arabinose dehydrogenase